ncbi:hypothetical protein BDV93DRAFT_528452 [Ceratobasidium sp. AG-I]|nr:hypothetical protein BDV93DRAFT_528452 [Ceratobasidium sp. AG-I]
MFTSIKFAAGIVAVVAGVVSAAPNPTEPSSTSVFKIGDTCSIKWDADSTKTWSSMSIQLMTGDNWNMVHITTVAQDIDATDATKNTFTYDCPEVTPTSAIYFYQFSTASAPTELLWTTRFTIAGAGGETTTPTETTQPNGDKIPWGTGALVDPSTAVAAPAYLSGAGQTTGSATGSASAGASTPAASASSAASSAAASASSAASSAANSMTTVRSSSSASRASAGSSTGTASAASSTSSTNAAVGGAVPGVMALVGAVFAVAGLV